MKIRIYGEPSDNTVWPPAYLPAIKRGLIELGHELVDDVKLADVLYCNDPNGEYQISHDTIDFNKPSVLNILDIPTYLSEFHLNRVLGNLNWRIEQVNAVTSISKTVQSQIKEIFGVDSTVVYQPTKPITRLNLEKKESGVKFLYVGRAHSPNKRFDLVKNLIQKYYEEGQLLIIGSENPCFGTYVGMVNDVTLNNYYNLCDYVLLPSSFEGIGLTSIEAILAGKYPILSNDCAAAIEFLPEFACDPNPAAMFEKIQEIENNKSHYDWLVRQYDRKYREQFNYKSVAQNIVNVLESVI